jgi:hypothetical protein
MGRNLPLPVGQGLPARRLVERLHLERLPGYTPELDADEGVWSSFKRGNVGSTRTHPSLPPATATEGRK